jgi:ribonuclease-3 family protein
MTPSATLALSAAQVQRLSPAAWAYVGDAVYELYVRQLCLFPPKRPQRYHQLVVSQVRAEQQATYLQLLHPSLTDHEKDVVRRGRNAASHRPSRHDLDTYQQSTGLEALVGYLHLTDPSRLEQILDLLKPHILETTRV